MTPTSEHAIWLNCFISWSTWYYTISHVHCLQKFPSAPFAGPHSLSLSSPFFLLLHCISISHACRSRPVPYGQLCSKWLGPHQSTQDSCPVPPFPRRPRQSKLPSFLLYPCLHSWQNRWVEIHMTYCTHPHNALSFFLSLFIVMISVFLLPRYYYSSTFSTLITDFHSPCTLATVNESYRSSSLNHRGGRCSRWEKTEKRKFCVSYSVFCKQKKKAIICYFYFSVVEYSLHRNTSISQVCQS